MLSLSQHQVLAPSPPASQSKVGLHLDPAKPLWWVPFVVGDSLFDMGA